MSSTVRPISAQGSPKNDDQNARATIPADVPEIKRRFELGGKTRYAIMVMGVIYLSILQSTVIAYNATFVAMMDITSSPYYYENITDYEISQIQWDSSELPIADRRFQYNALEKALTFAGAFGGALVGTQPVGGLIGKYGEHKVMMIIGMMATLCVVLVPICITTSFWLFVAVRFISGIALSNLFPIAGIIVNTWAPVTEKGLFVAVLSGHVELSPLFTMPMSGIVATGVSWPAVFYMHGLLCAIGTVVWILFYRNDPKTHQFVGRAELKIISEGKQAKVEGQRVEVPVVRIIRSIVIWAVWIAVIGNFFVAQFSITYAPMYLAYVLNYTALEAGLITMIPLGLLLVLKFATGMVSDRLKSISEVGKLRLFSSLSLLGSGCFFILVSFFPPGYHVGDVILIVIPVALLGFQSGGYPKCVVMVSRQHSAWVMGTVQMLAVSSLVVGSFVVPAMTTEDTFEQWRNVFTLYAALMVLCNTIFVCFARADPCKWTFDAAIGQDQVKAEEAVERAVRKMSTAPTTSPADALPPASTTQIPVQRRTSHSDSVYSV